MKIWDICGHLQLVSSIFIKSSSNESILKKSFQKFVFWAVQKNVIFRKTSKTTQLWQCAVTKPLDLQQTKRYLWKEKVHIFHLAPWDFKLAHLLGHSDLMKIMAHFGRWRKMSIRSISSSLSLKQVKIKSEYFPVCDHDSRAEECVSMAWRNFASAVIISVSNHELFAGQQISITR